MVRIFAACLFFLAYELCSNHPYQVILSHVEPKGIGYKEGYTSLALFFTWPQKNSDWTVFWDARTHVFNEGKVAVNGGLGARYRWGTRLYGVNTYYDFRQSHANYNQISIGFESLGKRWDFRINGYLPVGRTEKTYGAAFAGIQNRQLLFSHKREFALSCIQAEAAIHVNEVKVPCCFAIGPYWMNGRNKNGWGGEARLTLDLSNYIWIEGNTSYDNLFKWIGQGRLGFTIPFGPTALRRLTVQRAVRREIIPLDQESFKAPAINPRTGKPYLF